MGKLKQFTAGALIGTAGMLALKSYPQYKRDLKAACKRVAAESQIIETAVGPVNYAIAGAGPPVLVSHGAGGGYDQALQVAQIFGHGNQWIAPSRFGYLGTVLPEDASPAAQADAHAVLLDALKIERVPIIGLSAGGPSALQFALRHPDRCSGLVMVSAISRAMIDVASNPEVMEKILDRLLISDWLIWLGSQFVMQKIVAPMGVPLKIVQQLNATDDAWLRTLLMYQLPVQSRRAGLVNDFSQVYQLAIFPVEQIRTPTLVIHTKDDSLVPIKHAHFCAENIPKARFVELPSGGHLLIGQRARVQAEVEPFLAKVGSRE